MAVVVRAMGHPGISEETEERRISPGKHGWWAIKVTVTKDAENFRTDSDMDKVFQIGRSSMAVCATKGVLEFLYPGPFHIEAGHCEKRGCRVRI